MKVLYIGKEAKNIGRFGFVEPGQVLNFNPAEEAYTRDNPQYKVLDAAEASAAEKKFADAQAAKMGVSRVSPGGKGDSPKNKLLPVGQAKKKITLTQADIDVLKEQLAEKEEVDLDAIIKALIADGNDIAAAATVEDKRLAIALHYETLKA